MQSDGIVLPSLAFGPLLDEEMYRRLEAEAMKRSFGVSVIHISIEMELDTIPDPVELAGFLYR